MAGTSIERWVPGVRAAASTGGRGCAPTSSPALVLAAILVPQGMAYAELAGLPAVTGLYTTIGCLVGYAIFGPSRVLVLGPDSSVSPLIFAAIIPLTATERPRHGDRAGRDARADRRRSSRSASASGKLGFVADLLSSEVQVGYMNGLAITIIVGQLPKLFGFSTDADGFVDEIREFFEQPRRHRDGGAGRRRRRARRAPRAAPLTKKVPAVLVAMVVGATVGLGRVRARGRDRHGRRAAERLPDARRCRGPAERRRAAARSRRSASRWSRSPTPSPRRRRSPPSAATRSTRTRR